MSKVLTVKVKDWEVCCDIFVNAVIHEDIIMSYGQLYLRLTHSDNKIEYCPFCGKSIDYPLERKKKDE